MSDDEKQLIIDGIAVRLQRIRDRLEDFRIKEEYTKEQIKGIYDQMRELYEDLRTIDEEIRRAQQVVLPPNWRLIFPHQIEFLQEIMKLADEFILALALRGAGVEVVEKVRRAVERGRRGDQDRQPGQVEVIGKVQRAVERASGPKKDDEEAGEE